MPSLRKPAAPRRDLLVESLLVLALAGEALLLVALVMHGPEDRNARGFVGAVGHFSAAVFYGAFGVLSFLLVALAIWTTALRLARRELSSPRSRAIGFVLLVLGGCTLVAKMFPETESLSAAERPWGFAPGGFVGEIARDLFMPAFGHFGTVLAGIVLLCTGLAFATDWLLYEMVFEGAKRAGSLLGHMRRFWPEPVLAGAAGAAQAKPPRKAKKDPLAAEPLQLAVAPAAPPVAVDKDGVTLDDPEFVVPPELAERLAPLPDGVEKPAKSRKKAEPEIDDAGLDDSCPDGEIETREMDPAAFVAAPEIETEEPAAPPAPVLPKLEVKLEPPKPAKAAAPRIERPRKEGEYEFPSHQLLERAKPRNLKQLEKAIQDNAEILQRTLAEFKVEGQVVAYQQGPVVTMLEVALAPGTKVTKIHSLADDIAMALKAESVRIVAPIPGKSTVGVEIPNPVRDDVRMLQLLESEELRTSSAAIPMLLGAAADGRPQVDDLSGMPHLLIAGSTGSGKSVCINTILLSILMTRTPDQVRLILIDPKQVELSFFADIPHLLSPVVTDMKRAAAVLEWALDKMEERYDLLRRFECRNIAAYNELGEKAILARSKELEMDDEVVQIKLPYIVIIVDELADLMLTVGKDVEIAITRLAQKSRAVGIHVILATQRPSTDVITGLIKANMPTRIAFKVASKIDSRVILDQNGAEKLLGMGDMLYMPPRSSTIARAQGTYASDREVKRVVGFLRERYPQEFSDELVNLNTAPMLDSSEKDELYDQAVRIVLTEQRGSASLLQRALAIGYTRASRLLDLMRVEGVVGAYKGSKASEVQMTLEQYEQRVAAMGGGDAASRDTQDDFAEE